MFFPEAVLLNLFLFVHYCASGCTDIFVYNGDKRIGRLTQGFITIDSSKFNNAIHLRVNLSSSETLSTDNLGKLTLSKPQNEILFNMSNDSSLIYKLDFPWNTTRRLILEGIQINDINYNCRNFEYKIQPKTFIILEHYLQLVERTTIPSVQRVTYLAPEEIVDEAAEAGKKERVNQFCTKHANFNELISMNSSALLPYKTWPWHASIFLWNMSRLEYICSGSFITNDHILTSASCLVSEGSEIPVRSLIVFWLKPGGLNSEVAYHSLEKYEIHPDFYDDENSSGGLAVLFMKGDDDKERPGVQPVCVYHPDSVADDEETGYIIDWKKNEQYRLNNPDKVGLTKLDIKFQDDSRINETDEEISHKFAFFAEETENSSNFCNTHPGSGLIIHSRKNHRFYLRGVFTKYLNNYENSSCNSGIFTDTEFFFDWIKETTSKL